MFQVAVIFPSHRFAVIVLSWCSHKIRNFMKFLKFEMGRKEDHKEAKRARFLLELQARFCFFECSIPGIYFDFKNKKQWSWYTGKNEENGKGPEGNHRRKREGPVVHGPSSLLLMRRRRFVNSEILYFLSLWVSWPRFLFQQKTTTRFPSKKTTVLEEEQERLNPRLTSEQSLYLEK